MIIKDPILLVVIVPVVLLFFLFKMVIVSAFGAIGDLKKSDDDMV